MWTSYAPEVETDETWKAAHTDQKTPTAVNIGDCSWSGLYWVLINSDYDERNESSCKSAPSLCREDGGHHATPDARGGELGGDHGREWVVPADTDSGEKPPYDQLETKFSEGYNQTTANIVQTVPMMSTAPDWPQSVCAKVPLITRRAWGQTTLARKI
jgi:hypothetical protein